MATSGIFSDPIKLFIRQAYLQRALQPADVTLALNKKFGTTFVTKQISRHINDQGLSRRRKEVQAKVEAQLSMSNAAIATELHGKMQSRFAEKAAAGADKALDFVAKAHDGKSLASAAGAAKTLVSLYLLCSGISTTVGGTNGPRSTTFNFNFAATKPVRDGEADEARIAAAAQIMEAEVAVADEDVVAADVEDGAAEDGDGVGEVAGS